MYGSARLGTEQVEHSMRGLVKNDALTDEITRAREQHGDNWQQRLDEQYEGRFYERLQEAWGNEWSTRLDIVLQGNNDGWLIEQIRNESYTLQVGNKRYELSNHLGNVLAVVSDKKEQSDGVTWSAVVVSAQDYFPFGMAMPGRSSGTYRYGFNGKETDPETGIQDYGMRWYLPNIARFPSIDPITAQYPELTPYQFASNTPIAAMDIDGLEAGIIIGGIGGGLAKGGMALLRGKTWKESAKEAMKGAIAGAASGAVVDLAVYTGGVSLVTTAAFSGVIGSVTEQSLDKMDGTRQEVSAAEAAAAGMTGVLLQGAVLKMVPEVSATTPLKTPRTNSSRSASNPPTPKRYPANPNQDYFPDLRSDMAKVANMTGEASIKKDVFNVKINTIAATIEGQGTFTTLTQKVEAMARKAGIKEIVIEFHHIKNPGIETNVTKSGRQLSDMFGYKFTHENAVTTWKKTL